MPKYKLPKLGDGWFQFNFGGMKYPYRAVSLRIARAQAKRMLGSFHTAVMPSSKGKGYEVWYSEVTTADIKKAPKGAGYICQYLDFTLKKSKPHNFFKRVR